MTTDGLPFVMSHACVVCVMVQPQAPPPMALYGVGNDGSLGRLSCRERTLSGSTDTTSGRLFRRSAPDPPGRSTRPAGFSHRGRVCPSPDAGPARAGLESRGCLSPDSMFVADDDAQSRLV